MWALVLLAVIASSLTIRTRLDAKAGRNDAEHAAARALAEAGVARAIVSLLDPVAERRWRVDGTPYALRLARGEVSIRIEDEGGKIDVNAAPPELIAGALASLGVPEADATALADVILDWRDRDDVARPGGAEAPAYEAAEKPYRPVNGAITSIDELRLVLGMTAELHARLSPLVTVHSGQAGVDPRFASRGVLASLPGMAETTLDAVIAARQAAVDVTPGRIEGLARVMRFLSRSAGLVFTIRVEGRVASGAASRRAAVVQLSGVPARPYEILDWRSSE